MVNEAYPSARVFEEHVDLLLERLALALVKHVLGLERLVDGQVDGVVRVGHAGWRGRLGVARGHHLDDGRVVRVAAGRGRVDAEVFARLPALLHRRGHAPVMRFAEPGHPPVVVRPHLLVRLAVASRSASAAAAPKQSVPTPLFIVALLFRATGSGRRLFRWRASLQLVQRDLVANAAAATTDDAAATTARAAPVTPQRYFAGFPEQLHFLGAVHVDAKRPRQHPAASVRMAVAGHRVLAQARRLAGERDAEDARPPRCRVPRRPRDHASDGCPSR